MAEGNRTERTSLSRSLAGADERSCPWVSSKRNVKMNREPAETEKKEQGVERLVSGEEGTSHQAKNRER